MLKKLFNSAVSLKDKLPLTYSIVLIVAVPAALIANTWWNLHAFERDMDFAVREKALGIQQTFIAGIQEDSGNQEYVSRTIARTIEAESSLVAASVLMANPDGTFNVVASSRDTGQENDEEVFVNQLAWGQDESYFAKTFDTVTNQNTWMVISPVYNNQGEKIGLANFKVSSQAVDTITGRTTRDAVIILGVTVVFVILLLVNHLRFFEQSLMVDKLKQIDKMKDDFISVATHELKNPMVVIKSAAHLLRDTYIQKMPKEHAEWLDMIDNSVGQLNNLVKDLLNVSRIEQGRLDLTLSPVDSTTLITELVNQLRFSAKDKSLELIYTPSTQPIYVLANTDRLREVLHNLISNAIKYTLKGTVTVEQYVEKNTIKLLVKDTGIGISPEDKEKLFHKFVRIYSDQTKDVSGTGLGLWITKELVERMEGKIYVDSIMGQGTVFTVVLKSIQPTTNPTTQSQAQA